MSRSQDILGLMRGIQLVAGASLKTQEAYLKHLWSHSSVRDAVEKSASQTSECSKNVLSNPTQQLQKIGNALKETFERSSVVVEGIRQYSASGRSANAIGDFEVSNETKSYSTINNIKNLDIASITLKELENLLAEHNKMRQVNLRLDEAVKPTVKKSKKIEAKPEPVVEAVKIETANAPDPPPKPRVEPAPSISKDEKQVESVMNFITNYDRKSTTEQTLDANVSVPEVSHTSRFIN